MILACRLDIYICESMDTITPARDLLARLEALGDENRLRLLTLLDRHELTVSELVSVVQLPQSTVSRHLKVLADDGWVRWRQDGTTRHYRMSSELEGDAVELWRVASGSLTDAAWIAEDAERARSVLAARRERAQAFFSESASNWDTLRDELFGRDARLSVLFGLLDADWVVGDLGAGTGTLSDTIAPFVRRVIAENEGHDPSTWATRSWSRSATAVSSPMRNSASARAVVSRPD